MSKAETLNPNEDPLTQPADQESISSPYFQPNINYLIEPPNPELQNKDITVIVNLSETDDQPAPLEMKVPSNIFSRLSKALLEKDLTGKKVATGIVMISAAVGTGFAIKRALDKKKQKLQPVELTEQQMQRFEEIFRENRNIVFGYLKSNIWSIRDAEDLTQEVFFRALRHYHNFTPHKGINHPERAWLMRIAHNALVNHIRKSKNIDKTEIEIPRDDGSQPEETLLQFPDKKLSQIHSLEGEINEIPLEIENLRKVLGNLRDKDKLLLYLKLKGFSNAEIAYIFSNTEGAIKSHYHRAQRKIKNLLEQEDLEKEQPKKGYITIEPHHPQT